MLPSYLRRTIKLFPLILIDIQTELQLMGYDARIEMSIDRPMYYIRVLNKPKNLGPIYFDADIIGLDPEDEETFKINIIAHIENRFKEMEKNDNGIV